MTPIPYWRLSGFYFFYFATVGGFIPYWSLYLKHIGFNADAIGELSALLISTKMISPNLWGWIADRTGRGLRIIRIASFFAGLLFVGFLFFHGYWWFAVITLSFSFFWNAALPQFEAVTLQHVKTEPHRYSRIRLWGSVGFIVAVLGVGRLLDELGIDNLPIVVVSTLALMWLVSLIIPDAKRTTIHHADSVGMLHILTKPEVIAFLLVSLLVQLAHSPYYVFYSVYLKHYHYSASETGLLWTCGVLAEIVLFIYMKPLLKRVSLRSLLLSSVLLSVIRWLLIAHYADNLAILIMAQLLHAATFGGTHVAAMHLIYGYFGEQHQGKGQAIYTSLSFGLGGMLGSLYAGYYWESLGAEFVYLMAALCCTLALLIAYLWVGKANISRAGT
ncbi:MAG: MFS transporter [Methylococcales bacterium]|nr:MFS transporter [Methylococcales bacterium]